MKSEIAIVGIACRFPGADDVDVYWHNLVQGVNSIREITPDRWDIEKYYSLNIDDINKSVSKWCGLVDKVDHFDNTFFHISPREAKNMDPQQRILLEETWHCIEDAGIPLNRLQKERTSVYIGTMTGDYRQTIIGPEYDVDSYACLGNYEGMLANRLSYVFGFSGTSTSTNAACASSLAAIHDAKIALQNGECDYAIAGGVSLNLHPWKYIAFSKSRMLSPSGQCKTFDQAADGYVPGDGVGVLLLQPLDAALRDGNHIYGIVKGTAVNHGGKASSITAPRVESQKEVILCAYRDAGVSPETVTYWEAHGTGTSLGDPIEIEAATQAVREFTDKTGFCQIGSVKTNIGHLEAAAGAAGVIKVLQMMRYGHIPRTLHITTVNPMIDFSQTPFVVADQPLEWNRVDMNAPLRASVSSFGFGGVNAHIVLEQYSSVPWEQAPESEGGHPELFKLSACTVTGLKHQVENWKVYAAGAAFAEAELKSMCRTMLVGRGSYEVRTACWVKSKDDILDFLERAVEDAVSAKPVDLAFHIGDMDLIGFNDLRGWEAAEEAWSHLQELLTQVGGAVMWQRFRMHPWLKRDVPLFSALAGSMWIRTLIDAGLSPSLVTGEGIGFYVSLTASGMLSNLELAKILTGERLASDVILSRPRIVLLDPCSGMQIPVFHVSKEYIRSLLTKARVSVPVDYLFVIEKARMLFDCQYTFRNSLLEWDELLRNHHLSIAELLGEQELSAGKQGLLYTLIQIALKKLNRKWDLQLSGHQIHEEIEELVSLAVDEALPKHTLVHLFLHDNPDWDAACRLVQARHRLLPSACLKYGRQQRDGLEEIANVADWISEAAEISGISIPEGFRVVELGSVTQWEGSQDASVFSFPTMHDFHAAVHEPAAKMWLQGVNVDWTRLYAENKFCKISLPVYSYERKLYRLQQERVAEHRHIEQEAETVQELEEGEENLMESEQQLREPLSHLIESYIRVILAEKLDLSPDELRGDVHIEEYGIDSFVIQEFNRELEKNAGSLPKTLLFEYNTVQELAVYLAAEHKDRFVQMFSLQQATEDGQTESVEPIVKVEETVHRDQSEQDIAIIGVNCRYPGANTLEQFWELLRSGQDKVTEIPPDRWDWREYFDPDPAKSMEGKSYSKWGAFLSDVNRFDPLFFGISPKEAETMDPQERLFLESAWAVLEDAGYTAEELRALIDREKSADVGVFVGATTLSYLLWGPQMGKRQDGDEMVIPTSLPWSIANRVSYIFNFHGPSMPVDTACSASLSAIHLACESLRRGECSVALAGGINLYLHPSKYVWLSQMRMLSPTGRCHSFGAAGDGFVPGEGVGALLLKPLAAAVRDGDAIYAVIKGTAMNHGGRTNGYTVPNPHAQADVVKAAFRQAGIDPSSISYLEAHGTGTSLGDPIEIAGLAKAFGIKPNAGKSCSIGSVKSNIGHLESAAGIAGITKILLQMKHRHLVPSLHSNPVNPNIDFNNSPFQVQTELAPWVQPVDADGIALPRRAGVSSFGAGGANAHVLLEEYSAPSNGRVNLSVSQEPYLIVLSAAAEDRLQDYAGQLADHLLGNPASLADIAYTLQIGRKAMEYRLAMVVTNLQELINQLNHYRLTGGAKGGLLLGRARFSKRNSKTVSKEQQPAIGTDLAEIAQYWVDGGELNWRKVCEQENKPFRRISLPTYPFSGERYWIPFDNAKPALAQVNDRAQSVFNLQPIALDFNASDSDGEEVTFSTLLTGHEYFIADHYVGVRKVLPGVAYVEMAREAAQQLDRGEVTKVKQIVLISPIFVDEESLRLCIVLRPHMVGRQFEIYSENLDGHKVVHGQGVIEIANDLGMREELPVYDIEAIKRRCTNKMVGKADVYRHLHAIELNLRASYQSIENLAIGDDEALALIQLPAHLQTLFNPTTLQPAMLDGALQVPPAGEMRGVEEMIHLPYTITEVAIYHPLTERLYSYTRLAKAKSGRTSSVPKFDVDLVDEAGRVLVRVIGFLARPVQPEHFQVQSTTPEVAVPRERAFYKPIWVKENLSLHPINGDSETWLLFDHEEARGLAMEKIRPVVVVTPGVKFRQISKMRYEINPKKPEEYVELLAALEGHQTVPRRILYAWGQPGLSADELRLQHQLNTTLFAVLYLSKALTKLKIKDEIRLLYMYNQSDGIPEPVFAALSGMMKSLHLENPKLHFRTLAFCGQSETADLLEREFASETPAGTEVRYRTGERWVQRYTASELEAEELTDSLPGLRPDGVYLITGGLGGLGRMFASELSARQKSVTLILTGRSTLNEQTQAWLSELQALGARVVYYPADLSYREETRRLIDEIKRRYGRINGVLHAAGVIRDAYYFRKSVAMVQEVAAPKVFGTMWLDEALAEEPLDYFVLFSSTTAVMGNYGQVDYAYANHFLDVFAEWRDAKRRSGERYGHTLSLNWPLWREGGMNVDEKSEALLLEQFGMAPMLTSTGLRAFEKSLKYIGNQIVVVEGNPSRTNEVLRTYTGKSMEMSMEPKSEHIQEVRALSPEIKEVNSQWVRRLEQRVTEIVSELLKIPANRIQPERDLAAYGFDSIRFVEFSNQLNKQLHTDVTPADFFEYPTLGELVDYLEKEYEDRLAPLFQVLSESASTAPVGQQATLPKVQKPVASGVNAEPRLDELEAQAAAQPLATVMNKEPIAIIGMSGSLPQSEDLAQFWQHLLNGTDLISEVPADRWDWKEYLGNPKDGNKTNSKWGGFIPDIDKFDAKFFGISPREAELMDPQQRILLETVWKTIEDAGYKVSDLSKTGLYVGASTNDYMELLQQSDLDIQAYTTTGNFHSILVNRISYLLNLNGPSFPIDTACSSSLVAVRQAVEGLWNGSCETAIVAGVNALLSPTIYISFAKAGMLCSDGRCKTFDQSANGYVRAEGVGAILLKPLSQAQKDCDNIYAVIRGTSVNHGGKVNTLTTPNPNAQAQLILSAFEEADIDPATITYMEAHGTGTSLGDPIEVNGLKKAFKEMANRKGSRLPAAYCGLGSVKTNIGHLEPAAGISGLLKVLLAMQHHTLPASLHLHERNPYVQIEGSPFYLLDKARSWARINDATGREVPRRAGVSSFGFGGVNAHVLLEEYETPDATADLRNEPALFVLSAKNEERLQAYAKRLLVYVRKRLSEQADSSFQDRLEVVRQEVRKQAADVLKLEANQLFEDEPLSEIGFDPMHISILMQRLNDHFQLNWQSSRFKEYPTIGQLSEEVAVELGRAGNADPTSGVSLHDLCYTLQVGREEMEERLAIVANGWEDLAGKLESFVLEGADADEIFQGQAEQNGQKSIGLLLEGREGKQFLCVLLEDRNWRKIGQLWVSGIAIDWTLLYPPNSVRRIPLPTYPFARDRYWFKSANRKHSALSIASVTTQSGTNIAPLPEHPLVGSLHLAFSLRQGLSFVFRMGASDPIIRDHSVGGKLLFPGVGVMEMARFAFQQLHPGVVPILEDVIWLQPLEIDQRQDVQLTLNEEGQGRFSFQLQRGEVIYATGYVCNEDSTSVQPPNIFVDELIATFRSCYGQNDLYTMLKQRGLEYGSYYQGIRELWVSGNAAASRIQVPSDFASELSTIVFQTTLMDSALQTVAGLIAHQDPNIAEFILPFNVGRIQWYAPLSSSSIVHVETVASGQFNVFIADEMGRICVAIRQFVVRRPQEGRLKESALEESFFYQPVWETCSLQASEKTTSVASMANGAMLLVTRPGVKAWEDTVRAAWPTQHIYEVELSSASVQNSDQKWQLNVDDPHAWLEVLARIPRVSTICYLGGLASDIDSGNLPLHEETNRSVLPLFYLLKALSEQGSIQTVQNVYVMTSNVINVHAAEKTQPFGAGLHGLVMSAAKEYSRLGIRLIDVTLAEEAAGQILKVFEEPVHPNGEPIALRNGQRFVRRFKPIKAPISSRSAFKPNGVYVILGGAGGIGLALTQYLVREIGAKVVLASRSDLNEKQRVLIREMEANGGNLLYVRADASRIDDMLRMKEQAKAAFGPIDGVIHAAIVLNDKIIERLDAADFRSVLTPKLEGSIALHEAFRYEPLNFMMFFSSAQSFTGSAGQSNYAAASTFIDAYARFIDGQERYPVYVVNWGYWGEVGIVATDDYKRRLESIGIYGISTAEGLSAVNRILLNETRQILAMKAEKSLMNRLEGGIVAQPMETGTQAFRELEMFADRLLLNMFQHHGLLRKGGERIDQQQIRERLAVISKYDRLLDSMLSRLENARFLEKRGSSVLVSSAVEQVELRKQLVRLKERKRELEHQYPQIKPHLHLLSVCMKHCDAVLRGQTLATEVIFPGSSMELVEAIYTGSYYVDLCNRHVVEAIKAYMQTHVQSGSKEVVHILEVGAGTGGTSAVVLEAIQEYAPYVRYHYTDISAGFTQYGRRRFGEKYPFVEFRTLSINRDLESQGYAQGKMNIVLAANVLHATSSIRKSLENVKSLLKEQGQLILNEVTAVQTFHTLTFGLLEGWWLYEDESLRLPGSPLLDTAAWQSVLEDLHFGAFQVMEAESDVSSPQEVLTAIRYVDPQTIVDAPLPDSKFSKSALQSVHVQQRLKDLLAKLLGTSSAEIHADRAFSTYGVDSIVGVEFINSINDEFDMRMRTMAIFDHPNLQALTVYLHSELAKYSTVGEQNLTLTVQDETKDFTSALEPVPLSTRLTADHIADMVVEQLAASLETAKSDIDRKRPFSTFGVDSIVGVELVNRINDTFKISMRTVSIFDHPSVQDLAQYIYTKFGDRLQTSGNLSENSDAMKLLNKLESGELSVEEVSNQLGGLLR